jgi:hypothetical protein
MLNHKLSENKEMTFNRLFRKKGNYWIKLRENQLNLPNFKSENAKQNSCLSNLRATKWNENKMVELVTLVADFSRGSL